MAWREQPGVRAGWAILRHSAPPGLCGSRPRIWRARLARAWSVLLRRAPLVTPIIIPRVMPLVMPRLLPRCVPPVVLLAGLCVTPAAQAFGLGDLFGAGGGMIVYDPSNHLETAVTAAQSVRQTALQVRAEIQRLQQLAIELQQLESLPAATVRAGLLESAGQLAVLDEAGATLGALSGELDDVRQRFGARLREIATLGVSPQAYLAQEVRSASLRQQAQQDLFAADRQSLAVLRTARQRIATLQTQIPASSGLQQSLQTSNQYLDLLAGQTTQLLQLTAAQAAAAAGRQQAQEADSALADSREAQRVDGDLQRIATLRSALRASEARQGWGVMRPLP